MTGAVPTTTAVVVTYNSRDAVLGLLPTLPPTVEGRPLRVVVVDNASGDGTPDAVREAAPHAVVVETGRNAGYAAAINVGARHAGDDDVLVVLNPDVRLHEDCLERLVRTARAPGVGIAVPRILDATDGSLAPSLRHDPSVRRAWATALLGGTRADRLGWGEAVRDPAEYERERDVDWATGAVLAVSPRTRRVVGDWDESYFLYSEEVDYCRRTRDHGLAVRYVPDAVAEHVGGPYRRDPGLWRLVIRNRVLEVARRSDPVTAGLFKAGVAVGEVVRWLRAAASSDGAGRRAAAVGLDAALETPSSGVGPQGFVWFAAQDWWYHNRAHSDFQLMQQVAREMPVLLVNSLGLRMPRSGVSTDPGRRVLRKLRSMTKLVRRPVPGLPRYHVMTPLMLPLYGDTTGARLNAWLVRQQVRLVARAIGIGPRPTIALTIPTAWPVVRRMRRSALLFNRSDLHSAFPEADGQWVGRLEDDLLRDADRVLYVSHELMAQDAPVVGDRGVFLGHGVDLDHFAPDGDDEPPEMRDVPRPVIGFFGGLDDYVVDLPLLAETARRIPDASLVLVGDAGSPIDDLLALPNVHWLGYQPYRRIPAFGRSFDVALMPWVESEWIRYANPIKLKEYLALNLPVVTTDYPEIRLDPAPVDVATCREEFVQLVRARLADPGERAPRRASVESSSWASLARRLLAVADAEGA